MENFEKYTDEAIIQKILSGETAMFEILIRRNNPFLYKTARAYNYNHEDAQDLMQEAFIDAFLQLSKFENRASFKTWIIKIMLNKCFGRKQKWDLKNIIVTDINDQSTPIYSSQKHTDTIKVVMNRELNIVIENALKELPLDYRMAFILREVNGLNVAETADTLNITEANVKVRLNRAKNMLRKEVEKSYSAEDIFEFNLIYCDGMVNSVMAKILKINTMEEE